MNDYEKYADDFLNETGIKITSEYLKTGKHFSDDKYPRDIYTITLSRGNRKYTFTFGQSFNCSGRYWKFGDYRSGVDYGKEIKKNGVGTGKFQISIPFGSFKEWKENKNFSQPSSYDVLACLTKYDPGSFEDFCADYGYDTDSRKAEKVYSGVINEWHNVSMLFNDAEIEKLAEIN